jgi:predicted RNase H-like HicB family nuclease
MKYRVYFYYDSDYEGYVADAMDLPGCVSQGKTLEEAQLNIKDAIKAYIEVEHEKSAEDRSYHLPEEIFIGEIGVG